MTAFEWNLLALGWFFAATRQNLTTVAANISAVNFFLFSGIALLKMLQVWGVLP